MLKFEEVELLVGHAVGGVCPFAVNEGVEVYLDESLKAYKTVYPAAGSGNSMIQLTIPELERYGQCKKWTTCVNKVWRYQKFSLTCSRRVC